MAFEPTTTSRAQANDPAGSPLTGAPGLHDRRRQGWAAGAVALVSGLLLPLAARAVPIQAPSGATVSPSPAGTPGMPAGPRRPGAIPAATLGHASGSDLSLSRGSGRPVPGRSQTMTAEN
jgi:hypothetical protein